MGAEGDAILVDLAGVAQAEDLEAIEVARDEYVGPADLVVVHEVLPVGRPGTDRRADIASFAVQKPMKGPNENAIATGDASGMADSPMTRSICPFTSTSATKATSARVDGTTRPRIANTRSEASNPSSKLPVMPVSAARSRLPKA